jgi:diamine N-acetyltransferase
MNNLRLERINDDNFYDITKLRLKKEQRGFIADNKYSLVHAYLAVINNQPVFPFGIFAGNKPVGFLMIGYDLCSDENRKNPDCNWLLENSYVLWRLMIDRRYQGNGYAKAATKLALEFIRTWPCGEAKYCWLSYDLNNSTARELYRSIGFKEIPEAYKEGGEMPAFLEL